MLKIMKTLTPNQIWNKVLLVKCFNIWKIKNNKYAIQYQENGKIYEHNKPLYQFAFDIKAISKEEYNLLFIKYNPQYN
jgi:hypothetical protein